MTEKCQEQIECLEQVKGGTAYLTVWVEAGRVKRGNVVTFKETGRRKWVVLTVFGRQEGERNRGWGLNLPKSQRTER